MPLTELLRMSKKKMEEGTSTSNNPSSRPDSDCVELVWENGQIMMQGKARKSSNSTNFQIIGLKPEENRNPNSSKVTKFSTMDSIMADFPISVPSCEMNVDQDVDLVPWLTYPMEEPLHNDYTSEFLHELSGVTINDLPSENQLGYSNKKGNFQGDNGHDNSLSFKNGIISKIPSNNEKDNRVESNPSSLSAFTTLRLQKLDSGGVGQSSTNNNSGFTNFPYFSWPPSLSKKIENDNKRCTLSVSNANSTLVNLESGCSQKEMVSNNQSIMESANQNSKVIPTKPSEELFSAKQGLIREEITKNYEQQNQVCDRNLEPVIATSSVCSANSAERGSDEPGHNLKRKSRETTESSGPSEEIEEESVGVKKHVSARAGCKRSRAAEVHNLSERRRRDRINEKMRALQELIPNCNKADKASMLDEAIEYLKTLQLQVQMLSMGSGIYMQPMMLPPGMQPHMPHFTPMGFGMGMGMGMGFNMLNMNNGVKMVPFQGPHYPVHGQGGPTFPGMMGPTLQAFPHPGQGLPMPIKQGSVGPLKIPMGVNASNVARSSDVPHLGQLSERKDSNPQTIPGSGTSNNMNQAPNQASNEGLSGVQPQSVNPTEKANEPANGKDAMLT